MAHELETLANGQTAFASARLPAWHQLGTIADTCMTAEDVMTKAWLGGWDVRKIRLQGIEETTTGAINRVECADKWMTVRTNPATGKTEYLGVVGEDDEGHLRHLRMHGAQDLQARGVLQLEVEQHGVGAQRQDVDHGLGRVVRLAHDLQTLDRGEQGKEPLADRRRVVDDVELVGFCGGVHGCHCRHPVPRGPSAGG